MPLNHSSLLRLAIALMFAVFAVGLSQPANAKKANAGAVEFDVPDDFTGVPGPPPALHQAASGISLEVSELPLQALQEFKGQAFLDFLASLGYTNAAFADGTLKRPGAYTYVLADAKGPQGPESRFLLVFGGGGKAAIVTAYAPKAEIASGHASRAQIETILSSAALPH